MSRLYWIAIFSVVVVCGGTAAHAEDAAAAKLPPKTAQAWTLDEAMARLSLYPEDVYLQYVAMQLARQENQTESIASAIEQLRWRGWRAGPDRRVDLFDLFAGSLAVQESLQLDTLRGQAGDNLAAMASASENTVKVASLAGPAVKSHPWGEMLAARQISGDKIEVSPLSLCVPEDQYFVEFRSLTKLLEASETGDLWGTHLVTQAAKSAASQEAAARIKRQLAIQTDPLSRPFYDTVVEEVAITGSDLYFREGTDITLLFAVKQPEIFATRMNAYLDAAEKAHKDAVRSSGKVGEVEYVSVTTPDRAVSAFSAWPRPNLHVRSNSKAAMERVLKAIAGDKDAPRLGETTEFRYIRTLMVHGDKREDGFVYLSDAFIRRVVSPEVKLTERRRMLCYNHLRMIAHGAMLYRTQYGKAPASLQEIIDGVCAPAGLVREGKDAMICPCGGKYALSADGTSGVCSHHGAAAELVPCRDLPLTSVTDKEAEEYKQFVTAYSQYWRRYFDPIAVRVKIDAKTFRAETIILPLIDNTIYSGLRMALGGEPEALDALPVPDRNIFTLAMRFDKKPIAQSSPMLHGLLGELSGSYGKTPQALNLDVEGFLMKGIGNQVSLNMYDASPMFDFNAGGFLGEMVGQFRGGVRSGMDSEMLPVSFLIASLNAPVYIAIPVQDAKVVDNFLKQLDVFLAQLARKPERNGFFGLDYDFYRVAAAESDPQVRCYAVVFGPVKWRVFFARIGDGFYIASKKFILDDIAALKPAAAGDKKAEGPTAHAMVRIRPENWKEVLPEYQLGWAENSRQACLNNLGPIASIARAAAAEKNSKATSADVCRQADAAYGVHFYCPEGGKYEVSADGKQVSCSLHGTAGAPRQRDGVAAKSSLGKLLSSFTGATAELTFLEDGLHAVLTLQRK